MVSESPENSLQYENGNERTWRERERREVKERERERERRKREESGYE